MSRGVRDPDYRHTTGTLHKCLECATLTQAPWDPVYGYRCDRHVVIQSCNIWCQRPDKHHGPCAPTSGPEENTLLFCQEVNSEFRTH